MRKELILWDSNAIQEWNRDVSLGEGGHGPSSFFPEECIIASSRWGGKAFSNETIAVFSSKGSIIISSNEGDCKRFQGL